MEEKIKNLKEQAMKKLEDIKNAQDVENIRVEFLGKKGEVVEILKNLKNVEQEKRKEVGEKANILREEIEKMIKEDRIVDSKILAVLTLYKNKIL